MVKTEAQGVNDVPIIKCIKVLAFAEVPQHGLGILASRSTGGSIWRDSQGAQIPCVADGIGLQLAVCQVPLLDQLVSATGHDDGIAAVECKADTDTHSEWLSSWTVYLHIPRVFHSLMVLSQEPETICPLSEEKATLITSLVWPTNQHMVVSIVRFQR
ncbi:hypothetical protein HJG60_012270 [Phyllostomus discolor]|uniref:Uncharacterized protein n=1 Tax=Phyllostomus discolor TaxID=89673 RepID=A0A834DPA2_9CHIR|nr:hypothetical protein HJG60_012270 [Phyllostomus discolor]